MKLILVWFLFIILCLNIGNVNPVNYIKQTINILVKKLESIIDETVENTECGEDLKKLIHDLLRRKKWAVQMLDACAKIEPGLLVGNVNQIGSYDECLAIEEYYGNRTIRGQYCTIILSPLADPELSIGNKKFLDPFFWIANFIGAKAFSFLKKNVIFMKMTYGLCLPSSCTVENMEYIWNYIESNLPAVANLQFNDVLCDYKEKPLFNIGIEHFIFFLFGLHFATLISATIYDIYFFDGDEESLLSYVCTLSLKRNVQKLFSTEVGVDNISCINGLKVLSMLWVMIGHRFLVNALTPNVNRLYLFEWKEHIENMAIIGATVSVDTFLTISGLLISYIYLRYTRMKNLRINITSFYLLRIFRLTAPLLAIILIYIAVLKYVNDGPLWPAISVKLATDCLYYGWTNLLYVNNFLQLTSQCLPQSWYLSVDSQLYFLFPLIFFSIKNNPKRTLYIMLSVGVISAICSLMITIQYEYHSSVFDFRYGNDLYQSTFLRMPVWLIGVTTGYFVFLNKDKDFNIPKHINLILWMVAGLILNSVVFGQIFLIKNENENTVLHSALFNAIGRPLWASAICWTIFACATKNGGIVNTFLSLPIFNFVAKITYSLYLVHFMVILVIAGRQRHIDHFNNFRAIHDFCGDSVFSLVVGICFSLLFESPVITFAKKVFRRFEESLENEELTLYTGIIRLKMWFLPVKIYTHTKVE